MTQPAAAGAVSPGPPWARPLLSRLDRASARVALRAGGVAAAVLATSSVHLQGRPSTLCVLRAVTGIPCPFCGGTTAAVDLGHGNFAGAMAASPLAVVLLAALPFLAVLPRPSWWASRLARRSVIVLALLASEVWQLARFGLILHAGAA